MKKKILGILVCMLMIASALSAAGTIKSDQNDNLKIELSTDIIEDLTTENRNEKVLIEKIERSSIVDSFNIPSLTARHPQKGSVSYAPVSRTPTMLGDATSGKDFCDLHGVPAYAISDWFYGLEWYANYQDPEEFGCTDVWPFEVLDVGFNIIVDYAMDIEVQGFVYDNVGDLSCPFPGSELCATPIYTVSIPDAGHWSIGLPFDEQCCVYEPYFAVIYIYTGLYGTGADAVCEDDSTDVCRSYTDYGYGWEDLVVDCGWPGAMMLWSDGYTSPQNDCPCPVTPEPFFVIPSDGDMVYGNVRLWAGEASGTEITYTEFYYSLDGEYWTLIGSDWDGTEIPSANRVDCNSPDGDGWSVYWDVSDMDEGLYYIKARMWTVLEDFGEVDIQVYVEPTPPVPTFYEPSYDDIVSDSITLSVSTTDENVNHVLYQYLPAVTNFSRVIERKCQLHYCLDIDGKDLSRVCCVPTATAACLKYWNDTIGGKYINITKNMTTGEWINQSVLVESLARKMHIHEKGVKNSNIAKGIIDYLNQQRVGPAYPNGLVVNVVDGASVVDPNTGAVTSGDANFSRYKEELEANSEDVLWDFKWYRKNATSGKYEFAGGHMVVGTGVNNTPGNDAIGRYHNVTFMDPWCGFELAVRMRDNGSFVDPWLGWVHPKLMVTVSENKTGSKLSLDDTWMTIATVYDPTGGWPATWDTTTVPNGIYFIRATMVDDTGWGDKDTIVVKVENEVVCGDVTNNGVIDLGDIVYLINYLYRNGPEPKPMTCVGDVNCDGVVNLGDVVKLINYLYRGGDPPCEECCR